MRDRVGVDQAVDRLDERDDARRTRMQTAKQDLLGKIRGFFGINDAN